MCWSLHSYCLVREPYVLHKFKNVAERGHTTTVTDVGLEYRVKVGHVQHVVQIWHITRSFTT